MTGPVSSSHPAARARGRHLVGTARAVGSLVLAVGGPNRSVALATLVVRGSQGRSQEAFALAYGIGLDELVALEGGEVPASAIPEPLLVLTPIAHLLSDLAVGQEGSAA